ncbi:MFS transporter [Rhodococcoides yunnanense]|uniref:MFS transporter n=1 Tax=Rhodococcoides yunnanense TaxID=278209 RepID=UPI000934BC06|nr:MFS transporter [Rhodococcus yunnanensis]
MRPDEEVALTPPQRWRAFAVCMVVTVTTVFDLTKVNVALPSIQDALGASSTELQLIVSGYVLTFGLALVPAGRIGDQRSRRLLFVIGLTIFATMSLACALAPTPDMLFAARLAQGIGAGIQMPQVLGLVQTLFQGDERARAFGIFGVTVGMTMAVGPTLGGLAIAIGGPTDGWRWIFWMNLPLALLALALARWALPPPPPASGRTLELDPVGLVLFTVSVLALMAPFLFTTGSPHDDPRRWWILALFAALAGAFTVWERHYEASGRRPLVPPGLFRVPSYRNGIVLASAYFAANPVILLMSTLYLQHGIGLAPVYAGMVSISFAVMSAVAAWIGGRVIARIGRALVVSGLVTVLAGVALLVLATLTTPTLTPWAMAAAMAVGGIGGGLVMTPNQTLTLAEVPVGQAGLAGSVGQLGQRVGGAVGAAIGLSLFYSSIYRETGATDTVDVSVYRHAYGFGMLSVAAFLAIALTVGIVDVSSRRRRVS